MSEITNPRLIIVQSETDKTQYFYIVLFDLPAMLETNGEDPSSIVPHLLGTELTYTSEGGYTLPENYNGETTTYILRPFSIVSPDESLPNITSICFKAGDTEKKGDTNGLKAKKLFPYPPSQTARLNTLTNLNFVCNNRCFVIQSHANSSTYFVGSLVDFPSDVVKVPGPVIVNTNELKIKHNAGTNPHKTQLVYRKNPVTYDSSTHTAEIVAIFVDGYNTADHKGIYINDDQSINLYANPWHGDLCS